MSLKDILEENRKVLAAWPQWKKEIASLKTRLAACEAERDRERMIAEHNLADTHEAEKRVSDLQHQLAQAEARVQAV